MTTIEIPHRDHVPARIQALADSLDEHDAFTLALYGTDQNPRRLLIAAAVRVQSMTCMCCDRHLSVIDPESRDAAGAKLCAPCYDEAGIENEHADGYHDDEPDPDRCRDCRWHLPCTTVVGQMGERCGEHSVKTWTTPSGMRYSECETHGAPDVTAEPKAAG